MNLCDIIIEEQEMKSCIICLMYHAKKAMVDGYVWGTSTTFFLSNVSSYYHNLALCIRKAKLSSSQYVLC